MITKKSYQVVSLKTKYPLLLKESLVIVLLFLITVLYFNQTIQNKVRVDFGATSLPDITSKVPITIIDQPVVKPPEIPKIPIQGGEDIDPNLEFEPITEEQIAGLIIWEPPVIDDGERIPKIPFIPYTENAEPIGGFTAIQRNVNYPEMAVEVGLEGQVHLRVFVDKTGKVGEYIVIKGVEGLNEAAIDAVKRTMFKPAMQRDKKVGVWISIPIVFKLR